MMSAIDEVVIQRGLPLEMVDQAGPILHEAFSRKLAIIIPNAQKAASVISACIDPEMCFSAFSRNQLYGVAGMQIGKRRFLNARWEPCRSILGFRSGLYAFLLIHLFYGKEDPAEIYIDVAAVSPEWRGCGIGARMLDGMAAYGRQLGLQALSLDVVNTNRGAQRLYERLGFVPVKKIHYPIPEGLVGFTASTIMRKPL